MHKLITNILSLRRTPSLLGRAGVGLLIAAAFPLIAACSSDDDYAAGPEPAADSQLVRFSSTNDNEVLITDGTETGTDITLLRKDSVGELTVPINVDYSVGNFVIPESVTFADGDTTATLHVTFDGYVAGTKAQISIPASYTNPYLVLDGSMTFTLKLVKLNHIANISYYRGTRFEQATSSLYAYDGQNKFVWKNFFDSGLDVAFTVSTDNSTGSYDASDLSKLNGEFIPLTNYTSYSSGTNDGYYLTEGIDSGVYPTWTPTGQTEEVTSFFYWGYSGAIYNFIDFDPSTNNQGYGYFWGAYVTYGESGAGYENVYFFINYLTDSEAE